MSLAAPVWARAPSMRSPGSSRADLIVVVAIALLAGGIAAASVSHWRETDKKVKCDNQLRTLGQGFTCYHDMVGGFPTEGGPQAQSVYGSLYSCLVGSACYATVDGKPPPPRAVAIYLCPARRDI